MSPAPQTPLPRPEVIAPAAKAPRAEWNLTWADVRNALINGNGVAKRLFLALLMCSAAVTTVITAGELYLRYVSEVSKIKADFSFISDIYRPVLVESVWVLDEKQIKTQMDGLLRLPNVRYAEIIVGDQVRWSVGSRNSRVELVTETPLIYRRGAEEKIIGLMRVIASEDAIIDSLWDQLLRTLVGNGVRTVLVGAFMLIIFQLLVTRHLLHLGQYLKTLPGQSDPPPFTLSRPTSGRWRPDILDQVAKSVNETVADLTQERQSARALTARLSKSEAMFRSIFTAAGSAIAVIDIESLRVTEANADACEMLGYTYQDMLNLSLTDYEADLSGDQLRELFAVCDATAGNRMFSRLRHRDGHLIDVDESSRVVTIGGNDVVVQVWRDITTQKNIERELAHTRDELALMAHSVPVAVYRIRPEPNGRAKFIYVSPPIERLTGVSAESIVADWASLLDKVYPDDRQQLLNAYTVAVERGLPTQHVFRVTLRPGEVRWLAAISEPRFESDGVVWYGYMQDVTTQQEATRALEQAQERFRATFESSPFAIAITRLSDGMVLLVNDSFESLFGWTSADLIGRPSGELLWPSMESRTLWSENLKVEGRIIDQEGQLSRRDGMLVDVSLSSSLIDVEGEACAISCFVEITERIRGREAERRAASVFANSVEGVLICDANSNIIDINPAFSIITGYERDEVLGKNPSILSSGRHSSDFYAAMWRSLNDYDLWRGEVWNRRKNGEVFPELLSISVVRDAANKAQEYIAVFSDISAMKVHEEELHRIAHYDSLTGLPNRRLLSDRLAMALSRARRDGSQLAVCLLDLDGFKPINDQYGHAAGDQFLVAISSALSIVLRGGDTLARLGGDEFVMLLGGLAGEDECRIALQRVLDIVQRPVTIDRIAMSVSVSIGVTLFPNDDADADALLRHADQAMYRAKEMGKNRYHFFDRESDRRQSAHREALQQLEGAFERREFVLWYQPKIDLHSGEVVGAEALIRWKQADGTIVPPAHFLPHMEGEDLEVAVSEWVIETALDDLGRLKAAGLPIQVSANMVSTHLGQAGFIVWLRDLLAEYPDYQAREFSLEILESAAIGDIEAVARQLEAVREMGIELALDDFGTGYSSLAYFRRLPVDVLKIDQGFVRDMLDDASDHNIVESVIRLAEVFERRAIAEGVETLDHWQALVRLGCDYGQGYGIARPMPFDKLVEWARTWAATSEYKAFSVAAQGYRSRQ